MGVPSEFASPLVSSPTVAHGFFSPILDGFKVSIATSSVVTTDIDSSTLGSVIVDIIHNVVLVVFQKVLPSANIETVFFVISKKVKLFYFKSVPLIDEIDALNKKINFVKL